MTASNNAGNDHQPRADDASDTVLVGPDEGGAAIQHNRSAPNQPGDAGARLFSALLKRGAGVLGRLMRRVNFRREQWLRGMYAGGRGNSTAKRYARLWAFVFRLGIQPRRWVTLEVAGRRSGRPRAFPLGMADWQGNWYLVSMLGECNWVRNVRAANGHAMLHGRISWSVILREVPVEERAPILRRYLNKVPGGRPHLPVDRHAPLDAFRAVAADIPVFLVTPELGQVQDHAGSRRAGASSCVGRRN